VPSRSLYPGVNCVSDEKCGRLVRRSTIATLAEFPPLDSAMKEVGRLVSPKVKERLGKASESRRNAIQTRDPQRREFWREIDRINIAPTTGF
jgi:hypothetical protein